MVDTSMADTSKSQQQTAPRPAVSDGKTLRPIWRNTDGNGDPDVGLYESTRYSHPGHPTWKLYCGDAPASVNGVFVEPPKHVYLDDRACYRILHFAGYNGAERGRSWRHDFDNRGQVKPHRRNRGRPAMDSEGDVLEVQTGPARSYRFGGAEDRKEVQLILKEIAAQAKGETLDMTNATAVKTSNVKTAAKRARDHLLNGIDISPSAPAKVDENDFEILNHGSKKPRLEDQTFAAVGTKSVSELRATIISLQDRARITADALLDLQKKNEQLEAGSQSQQILYHRATTDLTNLRALNANLSAQLRARVADASPSMAKDMEIVSLRNAATIYRSIAVQLWMRQNVTSQVLEKSEMAAKVIQELTNVLVGARKELKPLQSAREDALQEWEDFAGQVKMLLGDDWERFEKDARG